MRQRWTAHFRCCDVMTSLIALAVVGVLALAAPAGLAQEPRSGEDQQSAEDKQPAEDHQPAQESKTPNESKTSEQSKPAKSDSPDKSEPAKEKEAVKVIAPNPIYGEPLAPGIVKLMQNEIVNALRNRGNEGDFARFQSYAAGRLYASAGAFTGSELTGNCRLNWYAHLLRNPLKAPAEAEEFTRLLHKSIVDDPSGLGPALATAAEKLDIGLRKPRAFIPVHSPQEALGVVKQSLVDAQIAFAAALAPLSKGEVQELIQNLYPALVGQNHVGHTLNDRGTGRRLCDLMEKMDRTAMLDAAEALVPVSDPKLLDQLKQFPEQGDIIVEGVTGRVVAKIDTPAGAIVIGGKGGNTYQLDRMNGVAAVISLGGGNTYYEGTTSLERPVLLVLNLGGGNVFQASKPGVQGAAILGVSMLVNTEGNNRYRAEDVAQGSCLAGVGILLEYGGNNKYWGVRRVQAEALGGVGILINRGGHNDYHAAMWAQGFGSPLGFGLIENMGGYDHYYCGGLYPNSYKPETPGYEGWGQGVGAGIRQSADGGLGVLLDGGGHNVYEFDYLSHGGGYWCGMGFARDFGGNSQRLIARKAFYGGERTEPLFQRFGCGWGCHYSVGFCFDDRGNSTYEGSIMGSGMGWDCSVGVLCSMGGKDHYMATDGLTQGCGAQASLGILYHYGDDTVFDGYTQGYAPMGISYHHLPDCGGNFSFLINYGGKSTFGCGAASHSYMQRGAAGGFLIDRPRSGEVTTAAKPVEKNTATP